MIYRVEIRKDGAIASCDVVESALKDGGRVFYVDALNKEEACHKAKSQFNSLVSKGEAAKQQGICKWCLVAPAVGKIYCRECKSKHNALGRESRKINALPPEDRARAAADRAEVKRAERRAWAVAHAATARAAAREKTDARWDSDYKPPKRSNYWPVLRQCLRAYDRDPAGFRAWLLAKLGQEDAERHSETGARPERTAAE